MRLRRRAASRQHSLHPRMWVLFVVSWVSIVAVDCLAQWDHQRRCTKWFLQTEPSPDRVATILKPLSEREERFSPPDSQRQQVICASDAPLWRRLACVVEDSYYWHMHRVSRAQLEAMIDQSRPLPSGKQSRDCWRVLSNVSGREVVGFTDPETRIELAFVFEKGYLTSYSVAKSSHDMPRMPDWWTRAKMCQELLEYGWYGWLCLGLAAVALRACRVLLAELALMLAISVWVSHLPSPLCPECWVRLAGLRAHPWDAVMICTSLTLLSWAYFSWRAVSLIRCPVCDYNLRGNISGICPECGSAVPPETRERLAGARGQAGCDVPRPDQAAAKEDGEFLSPHDLPMHLGSLD